MSSKRISLNWVKGLNTAEAESLTERVIENEDLFIKATELIDSLIDVERTAQLSRNDYALPCWAEKQADSNGYQRALNEVKALFRVTQS